MTIWYFFDKRYWTEAQGRAYAFAEGERYAKYTAIDLGFLETRREVLALVDAGELTQQEAAERIRKLERKALLDIDKRRLQYGTGENVDALKEVSGVKVARSSQIRPFCDMSLLTGAATFGRLCLVTSHLEVKRMKVIGYVRVSTEDQAAHGVSLEAQRSKLEAYAALFDHELVAVVVDAGTSAKSLKRDGLQEALAALDAGQAEGLLVAKLDRLTRSVKDLGALLDTHFRARFSLLSVADQIDTSTAAGRLVLNVLASVSEWEREAIGERTSAALQHKIANGEHVGSPALGFDMVDGVLTKNLDESATLDRIRALAAEGRTLRDIPAVLAAEGHKTKRGGDWHPQTVSRAIKRMEATG